MKIQTFDKVTIQNLRRDIDEALRVVAEKHGIAIKAGNASYTPKTVSLKVELSTVGDDGTVVTKEMQAFTTLAPFYGLKPEDLGKTFKIGASTYKIVGLASRRTKNPIICEKDGKLVVVPSEHVVLGLGASK